MSEETNEIPEQDEPMAKHELGEIIDSALYVIQALSELDGVILAKDADDIDLIRKHSYKLIYAAQRKMLQHIKSDKT